MVFTHSRDNPQTNNTLFINERRKFQILITIKKTQNDSNDNIKAKLKAKVTNSIETRVLLARVLLPT
jgi:hypothetical protein